MKDRREWAGWGYLDCMGKGAGKCLWAYFLAYSYIYYIYYHKCLLDRIQNETFQ